MEPCNPSSQDSSRSNNQQQQQGEAPQDDSIHGVPSGAVVNLMDEDAIMQQQQQVGGSDTSEGPRTPNNSVAQIDSRNTDNLLDDEVDDNVDDTPDNFLLNPEDVEEVQIDDDVEPMDEDEEMEDAAAAAVVVPDMSKAQIQVHTGHVYALATYFNTTTRTLGILSGGGDDKSYWHQWNVATTTTPTTAVVSTPTSVLLSHAHTDSIACVAINLPYLEPTPEGSPPTRYLAVGAYDGAIVVYDVDTQMKVQDFEGPTDVEWLCFHPKGGTVILAGSAADGTIWMYHIPLKKCLQVFVGHENGVTAGAFSPDGRWALSASSDGTARIWAPRTGQCKHVFRFSTSPDNNTAGLTCLAVNGGNDGQCMVVGSENGLAHVCHVGTKKVVASLRHYEIPTNVAMANNNNNHDDDDEDETMELPMSVEAVGFCPQNVNPNWCATGGADGVLKIWDLANDGQCRQTCRFSAAAAAAPTATTTTPSDGDSSRGGGGLTCLRWHSALPLVFTASSSGVINLWDARSGRLLQSLTGHTDVINDMDVQFLDAEGFPGATAIVTTASDDKTIRMFEVNVQAALQQQQQL